MPLKEANPSPERHALDELSSPAIVLCLRKAGIFSEAILDFFQATFYHGKVKVTATIVAWATQKIFLDLVDDSSYFVPQSVKNKVMNCQ